VIGIPYKKVNNVVIYVNEELDKRYCELGLKDQSVKEKQKWRKKCLK
jgi:hypothetical protein